jgi:putative phosphoesterase
VHGSEVLEDEDNGQDRQWSAESARPTEIAKLSRRAGPLSKTIGLISDTHGLLRPEAVRALSGVRHIIHAGDIGGPEILEKLRAIAPVDAVRGNNDKGAWAAQIPLYLALELEGVSIHVLHDVNEIDVEPRAAGFDVVVSGHSHKPAVVERDGVQFVNPGSAGPRRFSLPVTIARLDVTTDEGRTRFTARIVEIM